MATNVESLLAIAGPMSPKPILIMGFPSTLSVSYISAIVHYLSDVPDRSPFTNHICTAYIRQG
jgi:hypothetical protein